MPLFLAASSLYPRPVLLAWRVEWAVCDLSFGSRRRSCRHAQLWSKERKRQTPIRRRFSRTQKRSGRCNVGNEMMKSGATIATFSLPASSLLP